jgi:hypothetical protein
MRKILFILLNLPFLIQAQIGVNTVTPNGMLDVNSTSNGMLIPRVSLTSVLDNTTVVNPQGGAVVTSTLVYNTTAAGVSPNNVFPGFYYWNNTALRWIPIDSSKNWSLFGNTGSTQPVNPAVYGTSTIGANENFIGATDGRDVVFGTNNIERMRINSFSGNVGIGNSNASNGKLEVINPNTGTGIYTRNDYTGNFNSFGIRAVSNNNPGYGYGGSFIGGYMGIYSVGAGGTSPNTTYAVYGVSNSTNGTGTRVGGFFTAYGATNNYGLIVDDGNTGIGTTTPTHKLHVAGNVRIVDGTQGNGKILTSNATGVASWQSAGIDNVVGVLSGTGVNIAYNQTVNFLQTGSYITLPPGRYAVNVTMLLARNSTSAPSPNNSFFWVRSSFSDSAGANPVSSPDIVGSTLASGNFGGTSVYAMLNGTIIINNTTAGNKTYYYVAGRTVFSNTTETLTGFGSTYWAENNIIAYRLN